jgi:hypothetical protein
MDIAVPGNAVAKREQPPPAQGNHFLRRRKTAVIAHNPSHQAGAQEHIRPLQEDYLRTCLAGSQGCRTARPTSTHYDYPGHI